MNPFATLDSLEAGRREQFDKLIGHALPPTATGYSLANPPEPSRAHRAYIRGFWLSQLLWFLGAQWRT